MDQKPERQYSRMAAGTALGAAIGLLISLAVDSLLGGSAKYIDRCCNWGSMGSTTQGEG